MGLRLSECGGYGPSAAGYTKADIAYLYARAAQMEDAKVLWKEATESDPKFSVDHPVLSAAWHMALRNIDTALEYLEKAYEQRDTNLLWIGVSPAWDPLRAQPRFKAVLQRLHLS